MVFYPTTVKLSNILTKAVEPADTQSSWHYSDGLAQWQRGREVRLPPSHLSKSQESSEPCITCQKYPKQNAPTYKDLPIRTGLLSNQPQIGRITSRQPLVWTKTIIVTMLVAFHQNTDQQQQQICSNRSWLISDQATPSGKPGPQTDQNAVE